MGMQQLRRFHLVGNITKEIMAVMLFSSNIRGNGTLVGKTLSRVDRPNSQMPICSSFQSTIKSTSSLNNATSKRELIAHFRSVKVPGGG